MLMISGLGQDMMVSSEPTTSTTTTYRSKLLSTAFSPRITEAIKTSVVVEASSDLTKQLQCLLNAAMQSPVVRDKFAQWQNSDIEGWNLVQRWSPIDVDGVIKTADSWIPRRESDTYGLLSRTGISQFWLGDAYGFGPSWMATNAASIVKTLADFVGPGIAGPCDFVALRAAATQAAAAEAAEQAAAAEAAAAAAAAAADAAAAAAAAEAARKAAEEAAILQQRAVVQMQVQEEIAQQQAPQQQQSPGMMVETAPPPGPLLTTMTTSMLPQRNWTKWAMIGGVAVGAGVLVAFLARR